MGGVELDRGRFVFGAVKVGLTDFRPEQVLGQAVRTPVGEASLAWRLGDRLLLRTNMDRDLYFSFYQDNVYYEQRHGGVESLVYLNRIFALEAGGELYRLIFPAVGDAEPPLYDEPRVDTIRLLRAGVRFKVQARSVAALALVSRKKTSNYPGSDDEQILVMTNLEASF